MALLLDDLLAIPTQQSVLDLEVLPELRARGVRVTDWIVGGIYRGMSYVVSKLRVDIITGRAAQVAAGFEDWAFGLVEAPGGIDVTGWAPVVAKQRYGVDRIEASYTRRTITLTNATATPYGPLDPGAIIVQFQDGGNRYVLDEAVTIAASGDTQAIFRSEFATDSAAGRIYTDPSDATLFLVSASYPGVTVSNPSTDYSDVAQVGSGVGTVTPGGTPSGSHTVAIRIITSGQVGAGTWQTKTDSDPWAAASTIGNITDLDSLGIDITPDNNGGNPAFIAGAVYYFSTPGSDIVQVGRDVETPQELGARCRGLWPSLAFAKDSQGNWIPTSPTMSAYEALARSASDQVKLCLVETDGTINNVVNVLIAGQGSPLGVDVVATVQAFFDAFTMLTDLPVVATTTESPITLGGATIYVKSALLATAQAALTTALRLYLGGVDPAASLGINGLVDRAYLVGLIRRTPGVTRTDADATLEINGSAADLQLPVSADYEQATWDQTAASAFTWVTT